MKKGSSIESPPDFSFTTERVGLGYAIITKSNKIFAPSFFSGSNTLKVTYLDKKYIEVVLSNEINELVKNKARDVFPNL